MALGKCLIEKTARLRGESGSFSGQRRAEVGEQCWHWYWGYLAQLDWQWRSGRLLSTRSAEDTPYKISMDSWFGYMNLNFSVAVYMGASKAGLVPRVEISRNGDGREGFDVENDPGFQACVDLWSRFWTSGAHENYLRASSQRQQEEQEVDALKTLYAELWSTHTDIITTSLPNARSMEKLLPEPERKFGLGWCNMVELLAAMGWTLLSLDALMENGAGYLPSRILDDEQTISWLERNRKDEFDATKQIIDLHDATPFQLSLMCGFFRRLTKNWEGERRKMPKTLKVFTKYGYASPIRKIAVLVRILAKVAMPRSVVEILGWSIAIGAGLSAFFAPSA